MKVANPIYDIVFKYMMEDERIARTFNKACENDAEMEHIDERQVHSRAGVDVADDNQDALGRRKVVGRDIRCYWQGFGHSQKNVG